VSKQETITRDSVTVKVNAVLWFRILDPGQGHPFRGNFQMAIYQVALTGLYATSLASTISMKCLKERDKINGILKASLNELASLGHKR